MSPKGLFYFIVQHSISVVVVVVIVVVIVDVWCSSSYLKTPRAPGSAAALKISCPSHSSALSGATGYSLVSVRATEVLKKRNKPWLAASTSSFGGTLGGLVGLSTGGVHFVSTFPALFKRTRPA